MHLYLRKNDGAVYGPADLATFDQWARDGRVAPEDMLSSDRRNWRPAIDVPELGMDWMVDLPDGSLYGPLNLASLAEMLDDGTLAPDAMLTHKKSGERFALGEASRLAEEKPPAPAPSPAVPARAKPHAEAPTAAAAQAPTAVTPPPQTREEWKALAQTRDFLDREVQKWKKMYEDEHAGSLKREQAAAERIEEYRRNELEARTRIEQLHRQYNQARENYRSLKESLDSAAGPGAQLSVLLEAYQELSQRYDSLMEQLTAKSTDVKALVESRTQVEQQAEARVKQMEELVRREREEADNARKRMADIEEAHLQLVKSYRELNARFIGTRGEQAPRQTAAPADANARHPADGSRGRIKLTRSRQDR